MIVTSVLASSTPTSAVELDTQTIELEPEIRIKVPVQYKYIHMNYYTFIVLISAFHMYRSYMTCKMFPPTPNGEKKKRL